MRKNKVLINNNNKPIKEMHSQSVIWGRDNKSHCQKEIHLLGTRQHMLLLWD
jgi:hypothetical protein